VTDAFLFSLEGIRISIKAPAALWRRTCAPLSLFCPSEAQGKMKTNPFYFVLPTTLTI
jgi:hypothetical protein